MMHTMLLEDEDVPLGDIEVGFCWGLLLGVIAFMIVAPFNWFVDANPDLAWAILLVCGFFAFCATGFKAYLGAALTTTICVWALLALAIMEFRTGGVVTGFGFVALAVFSFCIIDRYQDGLASRGY